MQELAANGDLFDYVQNSPFDEKMVKVLARQLLSGLKHMKDHGYAHRDIKPENIVMDASWNCKIIDWGFAKAYKEGGDLANTFFGSGSYMAPEIRNREAYDAHKADMFSVGVLLFVIYMRDYPWTSAVQSSSRYSLIQLGRPDLFWKRLSGRGQPRPFENDFKDLLNHLFDADPRARYSVEQAL